MKSSRIISALAALLLAVFLLGSCFESEKPPEYDTPDPGPMLGEYVGEYCSFNFGADHTIRLDISKEFSDSSGLPEGKSEGTFVFLFHNGEHRFDKAETLRITVDGKDYSFMNSPGVTCRDKLAFYLPNGDLVSFDLVQE